MYYTGTHQKLSFPGLYCVKLVLVCRSNSSSDWINVGKWDLVGHRCLQTVPELTGEPHIIAPRDDMNKVVYPPTTVEATESLRAVGRATNNAVSPPTEVEPTNGLGPPGGARQECYPYRSAWTHGRPDNTPQCKVTYSCCGAPKEATCMAHVAPESSKEDQIDSKERGGCSCWDVWYCTEFCVVWWCAKYCICFEIGMYLCLFSLYTSKTRV